MRRPDQTISDRMLGTHHWALVPEQPDPAKPAVLDDVKANGSADNLILRTADRLTANPLITVDQAARIVRMGSTTTVKKRGNLKDTTASATRGPPLQYPLDPACALEPFSNALSPG